MLEFDFKETGEYSLMIFGDDDSDHFHFHGTQFADIIQDERCLITDQDGTWPATIFDLKGSYEECLKLFNDIETHLKSQGFSVWSFSKDKSDVSSMRMLVNFPDEDVAYLEANNLMFLTDDNEEDNIAGQNIEDIVDGETREIV